MQLGRDALTDLLDQNTPFGRLALTHVLSTAGDTMVTISLAGSLFFSISPNAAQSRVILYLLLTAAPFRRRGAAHGTRDRPEPGGEAGIGDRLYGVCRALVCILMAGEVKSLLLFPARVHDARAVEGLPRDQGRPRARACEPGTDRAEGPCRR